MKRTLTILMLGCYLLLSVGVPVSAHYCSGKVTSFSFFNKLKKGCKCSSGTEKKDCCKDDVKVIKNDLHQKISANAAIKFLISIPQALSVNLLQSPLTLNLFTDNLNFLHFSKRRLHLLLSIFII